MKTKSPILLTLALCLAALLVDCLIIWALSASSPSFSRRWLTLCGVLIILAALGGYHLFDGRRPVSSADRFRYSAMCGAVNGLAGWATFTIAARAWNTSSLALTRSGGVSLSQNVWVEAGLGVLIGFLICYYGFRYINEP